MNIRRALIASALIVCVFAGRASNAAMDWPEPSLPAEITLQNVGEHMSINGMPVRILRFSTSHSGDELIASFRKQIRRDFTRTPMRGRNNVALVGGRVDDFWLTLQLEPQPNGEIRGTWSATPRFRADVQRAVATPPGFPGTATLTQQIDSFDIDKSSQLAMGTDPASIHGVAERLESTLREAGFNKDAWPEHNWTSDQRYAAVFSRSREQVVVTLQAQATGGTAIVINRIAALESLK